MEEVVPKHQSGRSTSEEISSDQKSLRQTIRTGLHGVLDLHAPGAAIAQQTLKTRLVMGRGDHQHLPDAGQHQGGEWVIHHGLVVDRQQLLADCPRDGVQAGTAAPRQDDSLAHSTHAGTERIRLPISRACRP